MVADNPAQQTIVGRRNPVVVIYRECGQGRDINPVLHLLVYRGCQLGIQPVDSLEKQDGVGTDAEGIPFVLTFPKLEIIDRHTDLLAAQKGRQVAVESLEIESIEGFIIVIAGLVAGCLLPVDEVIVK